MKQRPDYALQDDLRSAKGILVGLALIIPFWTASLASACDRTMMSYEAAVGCARAMGRVRPFELGRRAGIDWRVAVGYLDRMEQDGIASRMDARGWRDVAAAQAAESSGPACGFNHLGRGEAESSHNRRQFNAVRHLIARELHPDLSDDSQIRALKAELFKRIWPQIADLLRISAAA